ncbi:MAG: hypothetical protein KDA62_11030, partial [Planctomycetales bacterium]|nr:hypothetical protein [Planctomycetales bacterium]
LLTEAREKAGQIPEPLSRAYAYADLGRELQALGDAATAKQLFDDAHNLGDHVDSSMRPSLMDKIDAARQGR